MDDQEGTDSNLIDRHPNAIIGGVTGSAGGALIVWVASMAGVDIPAEVAPLVAGAVTALVLAIGREGIRGVVHSVWDGGAS